METSATFITLMIVIYFSDQEQIEIQIVHGIEKKGKNDKLNLNQQMKGCRLKRFK